MSTQVLSPFPLFTTIIGAPLNLGWVYIGEPNQDPETHPKQAYWDAGLTMPALQPFRTNGGYIVNGGDAATVFTDGAFSIRVRTNNGGTPGTQVFYRANVITADTLVDELRAELASTSGASLIGLEQGGTVQDAIQYVTPEMFGYESGPARTAILAAIDEAVSSGLDTLLLSGKTYPVSGQIDVPKNFTIISLGATLDGSTGFSVADGLSVLNVGSDTVTALPDLAGDESRGDTVIGFATAHGMSVGSVFAIYDPTDYSFSSARDYYRAGEFCQVTEIVSATQVRIASPLVASYLAATVDCYLLDTGTFNLIGELTVLPSQPSPTDATVGVTLNQIVSSNTGMLRVRTGDGVYAGIVARRCYKTTINYDVIQTGLSVSGDAYGMVWSNSQECSGFGTGTSARHGLSHGGAGDPADVPTRFITNQGSWGTNAEGDVPAVDIHGNCEGITVIGPILGGITLGGKGAKVTGPIYADPTSGVAVYMTEVKRPNFDFSNVTIIGNGVDPFALSIGLIDFGGSGQADEDDMESGVLNFSGATINAPAATCLFTGRKRNTDFDAAARHVIDFSGANVIINAGATTPILIDVVGVVDNWHMVDLRGMDMNANSASSIIEADEIWCYSQKGVGVLNYTTGVAVLSVDVTFTKPYPSGYFPQITAALRDNNVNGVRLDTVVGLVTNTGFNFKVGTINGTNFGAALAASFDWSAA